jgi:hypothetical protein
MRSPRTSASMESLAPQQSASPFHFEQNHPIQGSPASASQSAGLESVEADASLGLASSNFAELYGLTSDMEPILMV